MIHQDAPQDCSSDIENIDNFHILLFLSLDKYSATQIIANCKKHKIDLIVLVSGISEFQRLLVSTISIVVSQSVFHLAQLCNMGKLLELVDELGLKTAFLSNQRIL